MMDDGMSAAEIAGKMRVPHQEVVQMMSTERSKEVVNRGLLRESKEENMAAKTTDEQKQQIIAMQAEGKTQREIAQAVGVSKQTVCNVEKKAAAAEEAAQIAASGNVAVYGAPAPTAAAAAEIAPAVLVRMAEDGINARLLTIDQIQKQIATLQDRLVEIRAESAALKAWLKGAKG
jgi:DNA-binding XRE family transcriptional regulator